MHNGRTLRMFLELILGSGACFVAALLMPVSFWHSLGESGSALLTLAVAGLVTGVIVLRHRHAFTSTSLAQPSSVESAG